MDDLITFLRAQLDDDEWVARAAGRGWCPDDPRMSDAEIEHAVRWDPARVLAEVEAKRRILDDHKSDRNDECELCRVRGMDRNQAWPCLTVRLLAQPYADRTGWREEWRA